MTTCATIQAAWAATVWDEPTITDYTESIYAYEQTLGSEFEIAKLYYGESINFITYRVNVAQAFGTCGEVSYTYSVDVAYTRAQDTTGDAHAAIRDFFEDLFSIVVANLGDSWSSTVDYWIPPDVEPEIGEAVIDSQACWTSTARYRGFLATTN